MDFVIAVDGPAASGKGTVASRLAADLHLPYLDTGTLYRAVGVAVLDRGADPSDASAAEACARALSLEAMEEGALRTTAAGEAASQVAAHPAVRSALFELQRRFAEQPGGAVLDGRDIGAVIAPGAAAKLFVTAAPETRAQRRWKQLCAQGESLEYEAVLADIRRRDARDAGRDAAPLVQAPDAVLLDTTQSEYIRGRRCGPPHRRGGARSLGLSSRRRTPGVIQPRLSLRRLRAKLTSMRGSTARGLGFNPQPVRPCSRTAEPRARSSFGEPMADDMSMNPTRDDFAALLEETLAGRDIIEGSVVQGLVRGIEKDFVIVDVGLKTEGRISLKEFQAPTRTGARKVGDTVEVYLERVENAAGRGGHQPREGQREEAWTRLEGVYAEERARHGLDRRPREGRLHRRPRRRLGLPARLARSTSARCATSVR